MLVDQALTWTFFMKKYLGHVANAIGSSWVCNAQIVYGVFSQCESPVDVGERLRNSPPGPRYHLAPH